MKISLVIKHFDPCRGGAERWTWDYARWLLAQRHEVHVVASSFAAGNDADGAPRVVPHLVPSWRSALGWADAAADMAQRVRADVIHDMGCGWLGDVFQPHGGSRLASFEQNLLLLPAWLRPLKRLVARALPRYLDFAQLMRKQYAADGRRVIALSRMVAGHMRQFHAVPPERMEVIYNGVDVERFSPDACRPLRPGVRRKLGLRDETLLLVVAHNFRLKGVPTLLKTVSRLRRSGRAVHLAVAGGQATRAYQAMVGRLRIASHVTFLGPQADVVPYYAAADVYVHPTFYDPCSLVVLEAMACGLPVITSRFNGVAELICAEREGYVLNDPADHRELAERIEPLLNGDLRTRKGAAARQKAECHGWERNCQEVSAVYERAVRERDGRTPATRRAAA